MFKKAVSSLFGFLASLKLAIFLLLALGITLAAGTILESLHGAKAAQQVIYHHWAFNALLGFLAVNVSASTLNRLPWQRKHVGFVMTHAGILIILLGSWLTHRFAVEGQLALEEGERGGRILLEEPLLQISLPPARTAVLIPIKTPPFAWEGRRRLSTEAPGDLNVDLLAYYPHAEPRENVLPRPNGKPAVKVLLENQNMRTGGWLFAGDGERDTVNLGPASIRFSSQALGEEKPGDPKGVLVIETGGREVRVPVSAALERDVPVEGTPFSLRVKRHLPHAVVSDNQLVNQSDEPVNPACEVALRNDGREELHTVFAFFPDFPTLHGRKPGETGVRIRYEFQKPADPASNELRIIRNTEGNLLYQIKTRDTVSPAQPLEIGKSYPTGWMNFMFRAETYYAEAQYEHGFAPRPIPGEGKSPQPAALLEFEKGGERKKIWFTTGQRELFFLGSGAVQAVYGLRSLPLGFELELEDFMIDYYPGTDRPASFKSSVYLEDADKGVAQRVMISMNRPLTHRGYKIYQSGYQLNEGQPDISVFQVGRDPGIPVKYAGSLIMISGVLTMFYMKRFSNPKPVYPAGVACETKS